MGHGAFNQFFSEKPTVNGSGSRSVSDRDGIEFRAFIKWYSELSFGQAIAWAYNHPLSEVREIYWQNTLEDLNQKIEFKVAEKQIDAIQQYEATAMVVSQAFGGSKKDNGKSGLVSAPVKPENQAHTSAEAFAIFARAFGKK